ncbi:alpha-lytic protease prodomain-containing protein [Sarocladium implicatum]|nr:alpha-lytic protease prodomain-containing protein [Sarocladium implicatum]
MEIIKFLGLLATFLPLAYGAPTQAMNTLHPEIVAAMKRDLGLDADQAHARVAREITAVEIIDALKTSTGKAFAGAWVADNGETINVGVTDEKLAEEVKAAGATPVIMVNSFNKLEEAMKALDELAEGPKILSDEKSNVAAWYVDVESNKLVIEALEDSTDKAEEMAAQVGLDKSEFEVKVVQDMPSTYATIRGGDAYLISGTSRCSVGFNVNGGFVTAGHCGRVGASTTTSGGQSLGSFAGSSFPGNDYAWVRTVSGHTLTGTINGYGSGNLPVSGSSQAAVGSSVCRSGSTTGVFCGTVRQFGATVNYSQGSVRGLTGTSVCAEPGDSGGSFYTGAQAQGVTSGGSGNCNSGGTTYFQPVNPILSAYGLTLIRS